MKIARIGDFGRERPAVIVGSKAILVDSIISDWSRTELENGAVERVAQSELTQLPHEEFGKRRIGAPIKSPTKVICVGLNYVGHIKETNSKTPTEPIIFMKAPDSVVGPMIVWRFHQIANPQITKLSWQSLLAKELFIWNLLHNHKLMFWVTRSAKI